MAHAMQDIVLYAAFSGGVSGALFTREPEGVARVRYICDEMGYFGLYLRIPFSTLLLKL